MRQRLCTITLGVLLLPMVALADSITYQGQLDSGGAPVDDELAMVFELFTDASGGSLVATREYVVEVENGLFQVDLEFGSAAFDGSERWLEVAIEQPDGSMAVTDERQRVTRVPMAFHADEAASGGSGDSSGNGPGSLWSSADHGISYDENVGIGNPPLNSTRLLVRGSGHSSPFMVTAGADISLATYANNSVSIGGGSSGPADGLLVEGSSVFEGNQNRFDGRVGVGGPVGSGTQLQVNGSGASVPMIVQSSGGTAMVARSNAGVTIGANSPAPDNGLRVSGPGRFQDAIVVGAGSPAGRIHSRSGGGDRLALVLENSSDSTGWAVNPSDDYLLFGYSSNVGSSAFMPRGGIDKNTGEYVTSSDRRLKTDIRPLDSVLEGIEGLAPRSYRFKDQDGDETTQRSIGFVAQEVAEVFPELVSDDTGSGYMGVNYAHFSVLAIQAIQEQQQQLDQHTERLAAREARIEAQAEEIAALRAELEASEQRVADRLAAIEAVLLDGERVAGVE